MYVFLRILLKRNSVKYLSKIKTKFYFPCRKRNFWKFGWNSIREDNGQKTGPVAIVWEKNSRVNGLTTRPGLKMRVYRKYLSYNTPVNWLKSHLFNVNDQVRYNACSLLIRQLR